ncbi:LytR/AlgR family response regulator transcription factor [Ascidiimonas sp. W6]|uniref:LytR/AlgR family response regulator transcription factor n=1 Tax=Ascidiimonas meishanensis TaxID=3128903 RepID=UPI0030EEE34A
MKYSYIIVDHHKKSVDNLHSVLSGFPDFYCRGIAHNEEDALDLILEQTPQLIFLDPDIPGENDQVSRFTILNELVHYLTELPDVIVVTATEKYALKAIKHSVLDYIVKPSSKRELRKALFRYSKKREQRKDTLCLQSYGDYKFLEIDDIQYLRADNNNTDFFLSDGRKVSAFKTLKHFEESLPSYFVRVHNSYIINTHYVSRIHFGKSKCSIKSSDELIPFSRTYKQNVETMKNLMKNKNVLEF